MRRGPALYLTPSADSQSSRRCSERLGPTYGALYYFNYHIVTNAWLWAKPHAITIETTTSRTSFQIMD